MEKLFLVGMHLTELVFRISSFFEPLFSFILFVCLNFVYVATLETQIDNICHDGMLSFPFSCFICVGYLLLLGNATKRRIKLVNLPEICLYFRFLGFPYWKAEKMIIIKTVSSMLIPVTAKLLITGYTYLLIFVLCCYC